MSGSVIGTVTMTRTVRIVVVVLDTDFDYFSWQEEDPNEDDMQRLVAYRSGVETNEYRYDWVRSTNPQVFDEQETR